MTVIIIGIAAALAALAVVVLVRTIKFVPKKEERKVADPVELNNEKIVADMADMIRCRTVSDRDVEKMDLGEFTKFQNLLSQRFPKVHQAAELHHIGRTGLLYHIKGRESQKPSVLMAHYDVVPAEAEAWEKPPFSGIVEDGYIWGRGTLDTKGTLCSIFQALEYLLSGDEGFIPAHDLYLSFSGGEEVDGADCPEIVSWLRERGIVPAMVLDEGELSLTESSLGWTDLVQ